ncbi:aldose 1-epimerase family protein [Flavobacterium sp. GCM10023249]|uniref:aldose 1-epimerase family protein n=1 Tax=unclassified Flavobacterium TaxID=196869 RepID=UPI0036150289
MIIELKSSESIVKISSLGAELLSFHSNNTNYIWTIDEKFWNKTSPLLFPIVGRLKNDEYFFSGKCYKLPRHGFARNLHFEVFEQTENSAAFVIKENQETLNNYPFCFELTIKYTLNENTLDILYSVKNNSTIAMPFSLGAHPAFRIDSNFDEYSLHFEKDDILIHHELENEGFNGKTSLIPLEKNKLALSYSLFEKDAIVLKTLNSEKVTLLKKNVPYLTVNFKGFPQLGIWTKPRAPFICIEPWHGFADTHNCSGNILEKEGINIIQPNEVFTTSLSIQTL